MKNYITILILLMSTSISFAQVNDKVILRGTVLLGNKTVANLNVVNSTTEKATATDENGNYEIIVSEGDVLVFFALKYQLQSITITKSIINRRRLVVEVKEKITELDEVVITSKDADESLRLQNEEFKKVFYEKDEATPVQNEALPLHLKGMQYGVNFVSIFNAVFKSKDKKEQEKVRLKPSQILRQVYDDQFFVTNLKIPQDKIDSFLYFCDDNLPTDHLISKQNEFELIDFLVTQSELFRKQNNIQN